MLEGVRRSHTGKKDWRLPITIDLLKKIIISLPGVCNSKYETKLFKSVLSLCFFGFLRAGEVSLSNNNRNHILSHDNIKRSGDSIEVFLTSSKTDQMRNGTTIVVRSQTDQSICPVLLLDMYLHERPPFPGPLFCHYDGNSLSRYQISAVISKALNFLGIDPSNYSTHSIRIGAATTCAMQGIPDSKIMEYGRWKSLAYKTYIRCPS